MACGEGVWHVGRFWIMIVTVLMAVLGVGGVGASDKSCFAVNRTETAFVGSPMELQAVFTPRGGAGVDLVCINGDQTLDDLSFLPRMELRNDLTLCGRRVSSSAITASPDFKMATVNGGLKVCNVSFIMDSPSEDPGLRLESMVFDIGPGASVVYSNVFFYLSEGPYGALRDALDARQGANGTQDAFRVASQRILLESVTFGRVKFEEVEVFLQESFLLPIPSRDAFDSVDINSTRGISRMRKARATQLLELVVNFLASIKVSKCLLMSVHGSSSPIPVERPTTLRAGAGGLVNLEFNTDMRRGFLDVQHQVRVDGLAIINEAIYLELERRDVETGGCRLSEAGCFESMKNETNVEAKVHREMFKYSRDGPECRFVARNALMVHSCDFVRDLALLLVFHRNRIAAETSLFAALDETIQLSEQETLGNTTIRFNRFVGLGMCLQNTTVTCAPSPVERGPEPRCRMFENTDTTDPEVTTDLSESYYYKEVDSSGDEEGINTSDYYPTSSDYENGGNTSDDNTVESNSTGIFLVATGALLWFVTACLFFYWYKTSRKARKPCELVAAEQGEAKGETKGDAKGEDEDSQEPASSSRACSQDELGFVDLVKCKGQDDLLGSGVTRESLIGAISSATAGIEDTSARIQRQIAAGGSGVVYKGTWKNITVAIKTVVFQDLSESSNRQKQRAIFEAAISSSVAHKNIVQTYAYSFKRLHASSMLTSDYKDPKQLNIESTTTGTGVVVDWKLYIVQEFCDGGSLRECLDKKMVLEKEDGRPKLGAICQLALEAASGMSHLHTQHNIVHGDLSSKNILLKRDPTDGPDVLGVAKIADFGLSIKMGMLQSHISNQRAGTPFYMAPELCHQGKLSKKADVFSFGVFMWELYHSKKCYHMNAKTGMQYHPLFPKFPIMCPIPYAMLCVVCISPKPENRPSFDFIARVFASLKKQVDAGMFNDFEEVRLKNMGLAAGLGRMTAPKILELIADQVGISVEDSLARGCSSSGQDESYSVQSETSRTDMSNSIKFPHSMFLPSNQLWSQNGSTSVDRSKEGEEVHLSQAYVAPFNCIVTVSVSTEVDPDAPKQAPQHEHFNISWQCEPAASEPWGERIPEETGSHISASCSRPGGAGSTASGSGGGGSTGYQVSNNPGYSRSDGMADATKDVIAQRKVPKPALGPCAANSSCRGDDPLSGDAAPSSNEWSSSGGDGTGKRLLPGPPRGRISPRVSPRLVPRAVGPKAAVSRQDCVPPHKLPVVQEECDTASGEVSSSILTTVDTEDTIDVQSAFMPSTRSGEEEDQCEDPDAALLEGMVHSDSHSVVDSHNPTTS
ncbi:unnamed protein product [Ostreobium quekettii]|uniref:Protein kinase domain-containing protein n=1 Tax=Ostreobium quekettii TaxID=121088 RepID=A0A8S1IXA4_9CHLO|nr:unnamed protein product [Ostreobium quekettii]|eukprot:evm.model.scf_377EXC.6 EVM.evm.TU.scf_377EXC.6   scf_377EXC:81892-86499(-)